MMLLPPERTRLTLLIGRERRGWLTDAEEREMRGLIGKEYPSEAQQFDRELLVRLGLGMMAAWHYFPDAFKDPVEGHA